MECNFEEKEILKQYSQIMQELKRQKIVRSRNSPVADYAEKIVADKLDLELAGKSCKGHDAIAPNGTRYQIKGRWLIDKKSSRQLSVIRNLKGDFFDYLIAVIFDLEFYVKEAWMIPKNIIHEYARFNEHQNGHILILKGKILRDKRVKRVRKIEERKQKMTGTTRKSTGTSPIKQGMVRTCGGDRGLLATFGIWPKKHGKWVTIHLAGDKDFNITTVTDNTNSIRCHRHLFERLKKLLIAYNKWPF